MKALPLPARQFVPADFDPCAPEQVRNLYESLLKRELPTSSHLRQWILDWSELDSAIRGKGAQLYIAATCDTRDSAAGKALEDFTAQIEPITSEQSDLLKRRLVAHPAKSSLNAEFGNWFRDVDAAIELFRPENIPLETQIALEVQAYQRITGAMSVSFDGQEKTLPQMAVYLQDPDRDLREKTWRLVAQRRLQDREALDQAFDRLFTLRRQVAANTGYAGRYLDYIFKAKGRWDYTPADCRAFHVAIERHVVPLIRKILERRARLMGLPRLRPWDLDCDPLGRPALKPFADSVELLAKSQEIFTAMSPQLGQWFSTMRDLELIDADSRLGKAPGGYQISLDEHRLPFIFMNASGSDGDLYTLFHEAGHSFHQFAMSRQPIIAFRDTPPEFAEVASMSMEFMASENLKPFYSDEHAARSRLNQLEETLILLPWIAMIDAFQMELYAMSDPRAEDRARIWNDLQKRFDVGVDWSGLEEERAALWQKQLHIFEIPFYYIEYGIAQLGALQVWRRYRQDPTSTQRDLLQAFSLGYSRPLPELFRTAGLRFDFSEYTLIPLLKFLDAEISSLQEHSP